MVDDRGPISPFGSFLFPNIFRSFRMAIQPSKLAIAFAAVIVICLTGWLMDLSRTVVVTGNDQTPNGGASGTAGIYAGFDAVGDSRRGVFATLWHLEAECFDVAIRAVMEPDPPALLSSILRFAQGPIWAFRYHTIYSIVFLGVVLVVLSLAGGAICRMSALQFARSEKVELAAAAKFSRKRLASFVAAPICPFAIAISLGLPVILLGLLGNIPIAGELFTSVFLPLALLIAPLIVVVLIGGVAGLNLLFPSIAYEDSDFFDAVSRSFSSVYARPWRLGFYTVVAIVYGAICCVFVRFFAFLILSSTHWFLQVGMGNAKLQMIWPKISDAAPFLPTAAATPDNWSLWLAALLIRVWVMVIVGLVVAFVISFYYSASTIIYALMRNRVDGTPLDEVYDDPEQATLGSPPSAISSPPENGQPETRMDQGSETPSETSA